MRDAFGGTFMFRLIIIFIVLFVTFATIAVSYAKTYRLKNAVIDIIEQNQLGYGNTNNTWNTDLIDNYLDKSRYDVNDNSTYKACNRQNGSSKSARLSRNGVCIALIEDGKSNYYRITLYMMIKIPGINYSAVIPVSGETKDYSKRYKIDKSKITD